MNHILSTNLKKLRLAKHLTQEQAADALNVSVQTVSRWECSSSLPDVTKLPEIARFYAVTIDDLFQETAVAYENYAQRLSSEYEASRTTENFVRVEQEFKRLIAQGSYSLDDMRTFGIMYQYMMLSCKDNALYWFDRILQEGASVDPGICRRTRAQKMRLLALLGRAGESVTAQLEEVRRNPHSADAWVLLVIAYIHTGQYEDALRCVTEAMAKFPEEWELYSHASDICTHLGDFEHALKYADEAEQRYGAPLVDTKYSRAWCYEKMGELPKAAEQYRAIAAQLKQEGFEIEAAAELRHASSILDQLSHDN